MDLDSVAKVTYFLDIYDVDHLIPYYPGGQGKPVEAKKLFQIRLSPAFSSQPPPKQFYGISLA